MPRTVSPTLRKMYERSNPRVRYAVEIIRPDVGQVFRRIDQFLGAPKVTEVPAGTLAADQNGGLSLTRTGAGLQLASFTVDNGSIDVQRPHPDNLFRGVLWTPDPAFPASIAKRISVRLHRNIGVGAPPLTLGLQVYKISRVIRETTNPKIRVADPTGTAGRKYTTFTPLLANPVTLRSNQNVGGVPGWVGDNATFEFDLTGLQLNLRRSGIDLGNPELSGEGTSYYFVIECLDASTDDSFEWIYDNVTARNVAGVGTFEYSEWQNAASGNAASWTETRFARVPTFTLHVETYPATSQAVYAIDLGAVPSALSAGRILFEREAPRGTTATLELSTAGVGGPWTAVTHGADVVTKQRNYHLRLTLNSDAANRQTPHVLGLGVEFRETVDASLEAVVEPVSQSINVPFCQATIGQGSIALVRTGRRDYRDLGSDLAVGGAASALEAEIHLMSDHPAVGRKDWLLINRVPVSDRQPTATSERFTMLSHLKQLQAKIPAREETVNRVYTVVAATVNQLTVDVSAPGAADDVQNAWTGQKFYMRVRQSSQVGVETGYVQTIDIATGPDKLKFTANLPGTLIAGDVVEVHSAQLVQPVLRWENADPADVWWEILTVHRAIPEERIGRAELGRSGRSGLPPRVTDRAPGDAASQPKLKVSLELQGAEDADKLIDQISFLMGGATIEVAGQIVFRQVYALRDITGAIVVPLEPIAAIFDEAVTAQLETPTGVERRVTSLACDYGLDTTMVAESAAPAKTTEYLDVDALVWLNQQDLHELGHITIPKEIARWCFNSADGGLLLASLMCQQVVMVASTGLHDWSWNSVEARPELVVGDRVVVITDQYTDFDPTRQIKVRGRWAYPLVLTSVEGGGRRFRGMVTGLSSAAPSIRGGAGTLGTSEASLATPGIDSLNDLKEIDSVDGLTRTIQFTAGARVHRVAVLKRSVIAPPTSDPWPPVDAAGLDAWMAAGGSVEFLVPNPVTRLVSYSVVKPDIAHQTFLQFEPRFQDLSAGPIRRVRVDAATGIPIAQGTVSVDANGAWSWSVDGHVLVDHYTYAESFSGFPNDASAAAGTLASGRQANRSGGTPLTFGQTVYVTLIPYDAQGNAMPSVRLRGSYQTFTATRTTTYSVGSFVELNDVAGGTPAHGFSLNGSLQPNGNGVADPEQSFACIVVLPDGTTLTDVYADVYSENDGSGGGSAQGHNTSIRFDRISSSGAVTNLGAVNAANNGGWQALHIALSELTTGRRYQIRWLTSQGSAPATPSHTRLAGFYLTHTIPDPSKGI